MIGKRLAHYDVTGLLGKGGMGEVYRALDTKLGREVALKLLPESMAQDPERAARFEREAKTLAALMHPHIGSIFGFEEADGQKFLALELVEGEDLSQRLKRGSIPMAEALEIGRQVSEGMEEAHRHGIVHRDLKPANIKLDPDGAVKILDFGLARAYREATPFDFDPNESPTITASLTMPGAILGTAAYMSPEQARGKPADARSDIWSFGVILFEMMTGQRPFKGESVTDLLSCILQQDPDWTRLPHTVDHRTQRLLQRCLNRDPRNRLQSIGDARIELEDILAEPATEAADRETVRSASASLLLWLLVPIAAFAVWFLKPSAGELLRESTRFEVALPAGLRVVTQYRHGLDVSPDGRTLAFVGGTAEDALDRSNAEIRIYLRRLDQWEAQAIPGTEGAYQPFFSPDGEWLAFHQDGSLKKVRLTGGEIQPLCENNSAGGATWSDDGFIYLTRLGTGGIQRVADSGGLAEVIKEDGEFASRLPHSLPGANAILYTSLHRGSLAALDWSRVHVYAHSFETGEEKLLIENAADARYVSTGHLVFARQANLIAVPFDLAALEVTGPEILVQEGVSQAIHGGAFDRSSGAAQFAISPSGTLAFLRGSAFPERIRSLSWVASDGTEEPLDLEPKQYTSVRISDDGQQLLLTTNYPPRDVFAYDLSRKILRRQTFDGNSYASVWGPEENEITIHSDRTPGAPSIYIKQLNSDPGVAQRFRDLERDYLYGWTPDASALITWRAGVGTRSDAWIHRRDEESAGLLQSRFSEAFVDISADGRWILYTSDQGDSGGRSDIYVRSYPEIGPAVQITQNGADAPAWSRDGRKIYYWVEDVAYAVPVDPTGTEMIAGTPERLFEFPRSALWPMRSYDIAPDGRFLLIKRPTREALEKIRDEVFPDRIHVIENWFSELVAMSSGGDAK